MGGRQIALAADIQNLQYRLCPLLCRVLKGDREGLRRLKLRVEDPPRRRHMVCCDEKLVERLSAFRAGWL